MLRALRLGVLVGALASTACETATNIPAFVIDSVDVASDEVAGTLDVTRSYQYRLGAPAPDSILADLWLGTLPVDRAWLPLDNLCAGPLGPRFTVLLTEHDARMAQYDFEPGTGQLACATTLRQYRIVEP